VEVGMGPELVRRSLREFRAGQKENPRALRPESTV
jgi:hypothetical protein